MLNQFRKAICLVLLLAELVTAPSFFRTAIAGEGELSKLNSEIQAANAKLREARATLENAGDLPRPEQLPLKLEVIQQKQVLRALQDKKLIVRAASLNKRIEKCVTAPCADCDPGNPPSTTCDGESGSLETPAAPSSLACEGVKPEALVGAELLLRDSTRKPDPDNRAAILSKVLGMAGEESTWNTLNITDMNGKGTDSENDKTSTAAFDRLMSGSSIELNHMTNFGLLQMSADRFAIHPADSLNALRRTFMGGAELHALTVDKQESGYFTAKYAKYGDVSAVEDDDFFNKCGTPRNLRSHPAFKGIGKDLPTLAQKIPLISKLVKGNGGNATGETLEAVKYIGKLLSACPRLNYELAYNEVERDGMNPKYFQSRDKQPICEDKILAFLKANPASGPTEPAAPAVTVAAPATTAAPSSAALPTDVISDASSALGASRQTLKKGQEYNADIRDEQLASLGKARESLAAVGTLSDAKADADKRKLLQNIKNQIAKHQAKSVDGSAASTVEKKPASTAQPVAPAPVVGQERKPSPRGRRADPESLRQGWSDYVNDGGNNSLAILFRQAQMDIDSNDLKSSRLDEIDDLVKAREKDLTEYNRDYAGNVTSPDLTALRAKVDKLKKDRDDWNKETEDNLKKHVKSLMLGNLGSTAPEYDNSLHDGLKSAYSDMTYQAQDGTRTLRYVSPPNKDNAKKILTLLKSQIDAKLGLKDRRGGVWVNSAEASRLKNEKGEVERLLNSLNQ